MLKRNVQWKWGAEMTVNEDVLFPGEKVLFMLRELYMSKGFQPYQMSKFEEYDLYARNKDFLVSDNVITFTDMGGRLMALKPDVTLSIIKNRKDLPNEVQRLFYNENVYRVSKGSDAFREIMQIGVECFGDLNEDILVEVLSLAAQSLSLLSEQSVLILSSLDILGAIIPRLCVDTGALYKAIGAKNLHEIDVLCKKDASDIPLRELLKQLIQLSGPVKEIIEPLDRLLSHEPAYTPFRALLLRLSDCPWAQLCHVDFSLIDDVSYYNGVIFKGYLQSFPNAVLSGGQYDRLMRKMQRQSRAVGFAVYTNELERMGETPEYDGMLNVALPKGRLGEKVYKTFVGAGYPCPEILQPNRKLIFENKAAGVRYFWVKPSDVAIYVERGVADIGVVGKDILLEHQLDVYELLDLKVGRCRMAVAAPKGFQDDHSGTLRVATKFSGIARRHYQAQGRDIDIVHLNGSIEIAPILGLTDVIVDIVETGTTLKENDLEVIEDIVSISARLIANKAAYEFKGSDIRRIVAGLSGAMEENQ
jgi:ATP phosphoribosyltransferase regulatory subunit